jgi:hypothetical protein
MGRVLSHFDTSLNVIYNNDSSDSSEPGSIFLYSALPLHFKIFRIRTIFIEIVFFD